MGLPKGDVNVGLEAPVTRVTRVTRDVVTTINHSYCSYKPTERYRLGGPHCREPNELNLLVEILKIPIFLGEINGLNGKSQVFR